MRSEQLWLEGIAREVRRRAGLRASELVSSLTIARRVLGVPVRVNRDLATQACILIDDRGHYRIILRELSDESHFAVAHELGHWALEHIARWRPPNEESIANRIAGAICAPASVVRSVARRHGPALKQHLRPLAKAAGISQTAANLRFGEVLNDERAVLTAAHENLMVRSRGQYPWELATVMRVAVGDAVDPRLESARLSGGIDSGRVALRAV